MSLHGVCRAGPTVAMESPARRARLRAQITCSWPSSAAAPATIERKASRPSQRVLAGSLAGRPVLLREGREDEQLTRLATCTHGRLIQASRAELPLLRPAPVTRRFTRPGTGEDVASLHARGSSAAQPTCLQRCAT